MAVAALPERGRAAGLAAALRDRLTKWLDVRSSTSRWRLFAILLFILNYKNTPFLWHIRLWRAIWYHLYFQPTPISRAALFKSSIISSRSPIAEVDYNLHKSNATYFSDLDIARTHLVSALLRTGILRANKKRRAAQKPAPGADVVPAAGSGRFLIALGGVACVFKKEIKPYEKYEIWTRLLCWDRKWLYIVSHFVKPGTNKPTSFALQPWKEGYTQAKISEEEEARVLKSVFATSIAKYVVKNGRMTVPPEQVLQNSDMLPEKPEGAVGAGDDSPSRSGTPVTESEILREGIAGGEAVEMTWEAVENRRRRGLKFAEMFGGLDGLHGTFDGGREGVVGEFADSILWR